jgi:hypothetical protein
VCLLLGCWKTQNSKVNIATFQKNHVGRRLPPKMESSRPKFWVFAFTLWLSPLLLSPPPLLSFPPPPLLPLPPPSHLPRPLSRLRSPTPHMHRSHPPPSLLDTLENYSFCANASTPRVAGEFSSPGRAQKMGGGNHKRGKKKKEKDMERKQSVSPSILLALGGCWECLLGVSSSTLNGVSSRETSKLEGLALGSLVLPCWFKVQREVG